MVTEIVDLDLGSNSSFKIVTMEGDIRSRFIEFHLSYNGEVFNLQNKSVKCRYVNGNTTEEVNLVINDRANGVCTLEIPYGITSIVQNGKCELIISQSSEILSTIPFSVEVSKSLVERATVESSNEFGALNDALWKIDGVNAELNNINSQLETIETQKADKTTVWTMANMGQDVKEAMTGGSVAVVGEDMVDAINIKNNAITDRHVLNISPSKIDGFTLKDESLNILNPNDFTGVGYNLDTTNGNIFVIDNNRWGVTGFIPVEPNTLYSFSLSVGVSDVDKVGNRICYYDKEYKFVSYAKTDDYQITIPDNNSIYYMRRTVTKDFCLSHGMMFKGASDIFRSYVPYKHDSIEINNLNIRKALGNRGIIMCQTENVFNPNCVEFNVSFNVSNGEIQGIENSEWGITGLIPISSGDIIHFYNYEPSSQVGKTIVYYDSNLNIVDFKIERNDIIKIYVPQNNKIAYFRRECNRSFKDSGMITIGLDRLTSFKPFNAQIEIPNLKLDKNKDIKSITNKLDNVTETFDFDGYRNIFDNTKWEGNKNLNTDNGETIDTNNSAWGVTGFIPVTPAKTYTFSYIPDSTKTTALGAQICYYDDNKRFVSSKIITNTTWTITVPNNNNIKYMRRSANFRFVTDGVVCEGDEFVTKYKDFVDIIDVSNIKTENSSIFISEDGIEYTLEINKYGEYKVIPKAHLNLPDDFPKYTVSGTSCRKEDFYITPHTSDYSNGYIFIMSHDGYVKKYKKLPSYAYNFRKYENSSGEIRFTYLQVDIREYPKINSNGGYDTTRLVVMDKNFKTIDEAILIGHGNVPNNFPSEAHDYIFIDDKHYILTAYQARKVTNIPNITGECRVVNCIIQEQKNKEVVFQWESVDEPKLYEYSCFNNEFENFVGADGVYNDYAHINSIDLDTKSNEILCSFRNIGLCKISRRDGSLLWFMGRNHSDIVGVTSEQNGYLQHHAKYNYDGSITIFDNSGCTTNNTRICRYWIDENSKTLTKFEELKTPKPRSGYMGSADLLDKSKNIYLIAYGGGFSDIAFHEYDFDNSKGIFKIVFNDGHDMYRIWRDYKLV